MSDEVEVFADYNRFNSNLSDGIEVKKKRVIEGIWYLCHKILHKNKKFERHRCTNTLFPVGSPSLFFDNQIDFEFKNLTLKDPKRYIS